MKKASVAIMMVQGEQVYLMKRIGTTTYRDFWAFAGGHIEQGETSLRSAERELEEEAGLKDRGDDLHYVGLNEVENDYLCVVYGIKLEFPDKLINCEPDKHSDWTKFSFKQVLELDGVIPGIRTLIAEHLIKNREHENW